MHPWTDHITRWEQHMTAAGRAPGTRRVRTDHIRHLARSHRDIHPSRITGDDLITWCAAQTWKLTTRASYRASMRGFFGWLHDDARINPARALPTVRVPAGVPRPTPDTVLRSATLAAGPREQLMILLIAQTGLRRGELAALHTNHVAHGFDGPYLRVVGKGGRTRRIPLLEQTAQDLGELDPGWVFPSPQGGHLTASHVGALLSSVLGPGWTAHSLRHRFATRAYAVDRDLRAVQELLGHSKPETTAGYTLVPLDAARRAVEAAAA